VPVEGSMARTIYDVLVAAEQCEEEFNAAVLAQLLCTSTNSVQVTVWRIRGAANRRGILDAGRDRCSSGLHKRGDSSATAFPCW
jgi:hypothetical protein